MVSNYKRKTEKASYSKEKLREAVRDVQTGKLSGYGAAKAYNIPRMTIMDHVNNRRFKSNTLGRSTALPAEIEQRLALCLQVMEKNYFGLSRQEVLELVAEFVQKNGLSTPFKHGIPGKVWLRSFSKRYNLSLKKPQGVEYARKTAIDPYIMYPYFDLLEKTLDELNLKENPSAVWNVDETSFSKDPEKTKVLGVKGHASKRMISTCGKENTTVLLGCSALGEKLPPLIIFKGKNVWDEWTSPDAYPGTTYAATQNGWMTAEVFEAFFKKSFVPAIGSQRPILLIFDGHSTHVGLNIIEEARKENITILKLPPHTSHVLQPLDVAVMKPFKNYWDPLLVKWQRQNVGKALPKKEFSRLIGNVWAQIDVKVIQNGFRKAGIYPINRDTIAEKEFDTMKLKQWKEFVKESLDTQTKNLQNDVRDTEKTNETIAKNPESLVSLLLKFFQRDLLPANNDVMNVTKNKTKTQKRSENIHDNCVDTSVSVKNVSFSQLEMENQEFPSKDLQFATITSLNAGPSITNSNVLTSINENSKNKIQILENRAITFEELLLMKMKPGINTKVKRRKIAYGAEVITHDDVLLRKKEDETKYIKKEKIMKSHPTANKKTLKRVPKKTGKIESKTKKKVKSIKIQSSTDESDISTIKYDDESDYENLEDFRLSVESSDDMIQNDVENRKIKEPVRSARNRNILKIKKEVGKSNIRTQEIEFKHGSDISHDNKEFDENYSDDSQEIIPKCKTPKVNDWLLVQFTTKKTIKHYVGVVVELNTDLKPVVKYLRKSKKRDGRTVFKYPNVEDISELTHLEDIISFLPEPLTERRGQIYFEKSFEGYNLQ